MSNVMHTKNELLARTLKTIELERPKFHESFQLVSELLQLYGELNLAERLYADCASSVAWPVIADLFSILIWSTNDNGHALTRTTEQWLVECSDERNVNVAINLDVYPFMEQADMAMYLSVAAMKFPSVTDRCNELLAGREKLNA